LKTGVSDRSSSACDRTGKASATPQREGARNGFGTKALYIFDGADLEVVPGEHAFFICQPDEKCGPPLRMSSEVSGEPFILFASVLTT